jgi:hypothetical protein
MVKDDPVITPTTDLFIAALWSAPKNEPILRSLLNAVMTDIGHPAVLLSEHFQMHILRLGDWLRNDLSGLDSLCIGLQRWMQFWAFGAKLEEGKMSTMLQDVPEVRSAYDEFNRLRSDPVMRERARARQRFLDEQMIIMNDVREEGEARGRSKRTRGR